MQLGIKAAPAACHLCKESHGTEACVKKGLTEIVFILDESGSMSGLEKDTVGGFNSFIRKQKDAEGEALVSLVLFNDSSRVVYDRVNISAIELMRLDQYCPGGCTALLDAIGGAIEHIKKVHKHIREEEVPEKTVFVITTDGQENASREYTYKKIKDLIQRRQKKAQWEFLFLGANIDAIGEASRMGIKANRAVRYECDEKGTQLNFECLSAALCEMRADGDIGDEWKEDIEEYYDMNSEETDS